MTSIRTEPVTPDLLRQWRLPRPAAGGRVGAGSASAASKHSRGHCLVIGGSRSTPGGALLSGIAALRVGAGVVALAVDPAAAIALAVELPEAAVVGFDDPSLADRLTRADAVLLGPGLDDLELTSQLLSTVIATQSNAALVLDAFGLSALARDDVRAKLPQQLVLTPNPDEARLLLDAVDLADCDLDETSRVAALLAERYCAVVAYSRQVASPDGRSWSITTGHSGLGTSGSGDVLAGAVTGLLARGADPAQAACWATHLHASAGDRLAAHVGRLGFLARELLAELPRGLTELEA